MSASPADRTPGRTPNGINVPPPRRRAPANPLVQPKKRPARPAPNSKAPVKGAGNAAAASQQVGGQKHRLVPQLETNNMQTLSLQLEADTTPSGFSAEAVDAKVQDYPLIISKGALKQGLRHHVAKFFSQKTIDPRDEGYFTRPVRLQRRDARAQPTEAKDGDEEDPNEDPEELARREQDKQQRQAQREVDLAQIAPSANSNVPKRTNNKQKKINEVLRKDHTDKQKAATQLRYEEALQWHLEDFDNKQSWVGGYESAMSGAYAHLIFKDGRFQLVPLEKWYKFIPKMHVRQMQLEEAEARIKQEADKNQDPRWLTDRKVAEKRAKDEDAENRKASSRLWVGSALGEQKGKAMTSRVKQEMLEVNDLDFEEDWADDEENPLWEGDQDDVKENEDRIKRDQLQANVFAMKDEKTYDQADALEKQARKAEKEHGKRVKKALMKRERNRIYESDSENPFDSGTDSTDSEEERQREEQLKKEAEEGANGSQGNNSSKNNTPSNRSSKHPDRNSLKRSGSANASDLSGNESSRKKQKKAHGSRLGTGANTPNGGTPRSRSPAPSQPKPGVRAAPSADTLKRRAGSGSEGEGAGSGGEMSDGTRKKIKVLVKKGQGPGASTQASPAGSRSPSPGRSTPREGAAGGKRAMSPDATARPGGQIPTEAQLRAAIPPEGITVIELSKKFGKGNILGPNKEEAFRRIKTVAVYDKATKKLVPKAGGGSA